MSEVVIELLFTMHILGEICEARILNNSCYAVILGCHRFQLLHGDLISS